MKLVGVCARLGMEVSRLKIVLGYSANNPAVRRIKMIPVISVVGSSGAGKTTLLEKVVKELKSRGYKVAAVKHDSHSFDIDHPGKDSWREFPGGL